MKPYSNNYKVKDKFSMQQFIGPNIKANMSYYFLTHNMNATTYYDYWKMISGQTSVDRAETSSSENTKQTRSRAHVIGTNRHKSSLTQHPETNTTNVQVK